MTWIFALVALRDEVDRLSLLLPFRRDTPEEFLASTCNLALLSSVNRSRIKSSEPWRYNKVVSLFPVPSLSIDGNKSQYAVAVSSEHVSETERWVIRGSSAQYGSLVVGRRCAGIPVGARGS